MDLKEFDVILRMDWLAHHKVVVDYYKKEVIIESSGQPKVVFVGKRQVVPVCVISTKEARRLILKRWEVYLAHVTNAEKVNPTLEEIPIVRDFLEVFPDDLPGLPPHKEVDFIVETVPGVAPISIALYRMTLVELQELKKQVEELLGKGFIRPSTSLWGASVVFVKKKDDSNKTSILLFFGLHFFLESLAAAAVGNPISESFPTSVIHRLPRRLTPSKLRRLRFCPPPQAATSKTAGPGPGAGRVFGAGRTRPVVIPRVMSIRFTDFLLEPVCSVEIRLAHQSFSPQFAVSVADYEQELVSPARRESYFRKLSLISYSPPTVSPDPLASCAASVFAQLLKLRLQRLCVGGGKPHIRWKCRCRGVLSHESFYNVLAASTYVLQEGDRPSRSGCIMLFDVDAEAGQLELIQKVETAGIFDIKWSPRLLQNPGCPLLAQADADGSVRIHSLQGSDSDGSKMHGNNLNELCGKCINSSMCLCIDWNSSATSMAVGLSDGSVSIISLDESQLNILQEWKAHDFELWAASF
ncbi:UNVERIFIED_CONTAM: hypothetical protein Scaly_1028300 [Sesamum calycinum]|uniref:Uncharacterized protein n=1 Tax=Sesamum calycinum TaxID=2727403 RepID=A0AAW2QKB2_9LAMI